MTKAEIVEKCRVMSAHMRKDALDMALAAGKNAAHFGAGMSIIDITATLYGGVLNLDPKNPEWEDRDRFILSKGHGVLGYYPALCEVGYIPYSDLLTFEQTGSYLAGHPVKDRSHGIEFTNGSLGMGLSLGIGVSLAARKREKDFKVYVLMGDGECNEGSVWEAAMSAAQFKLDHLIAIIDKNEFQLGGNNSDIMSIGEVSRKFSDFGWETVDVDGHDIGAIYDAFTATNHEGKPLAVIAHTIKGKGFSFSENNNAWHHAVLTKAQYEEAIKELESVAK